MNIFWETPLEESKRKVAHRWEMQIWARAPDFPRSADAFFPTNKTHEQLSQLSQGLILKDGPNQLRDKKIRDNALKILEEHGAVMLITAGKKKIIQVTLELK